MAAKSEGPRTAYGGVGYWINPGAENRNWSFSGIVIQWQVPPNLAPGVELFHGTSQQAGSRRRRGLISTRCGILAPCQHIMLSASGNVVKVQQKSREGIGHGMRVMRNVTESFGEDAHHDREQA